MRQTHKRHPYLHTTKGERMISRVIFLCAVIGFSVSNLLPVTVELPKPLTTAQLQAKAKKKQLSEICQKKKRSKTLMDICERWGEEA
jgi:hypothetical protein